MLACRDAEQAAAIAQTGRNPRYLTSCDLTGVEATTIAGAPIESAELVVLAVPSAVYGDVARALPGDAPVLSLTKGLDPETGSASPRSSVAARSPSSRAPTSPRRSRATCRPPR